MSEQHKRTKQIIIRVSEDEYHQLLENCLYPRLATRIRETCLGKKISRKPTHYTDKNLLAWLGRLNGNLNQIAKYINVQNKAKNQIDVLKIIAELALIRASLDQLLEIQYADKNIQK